MSMRLNMKSIGAMVIVASILVVGPILVVGSIATEEASSKNRHSLSLGLRPVKRHVQETAAPTGAAALRDPAQRGEYLVNHVAMCVYCHTPRQEDGTLIRQQLLSGAPMPLKSPFPGEVWRCAPRP